MDPKELGQSHEFTSHIDKLANAHRDIALDLERLRTIAEHSEKVSAEIHAKVETISEKQTELRVAVGKLEAKNGVIAGILGAVSGIFGAKFSGGG